MTEQHPLTDEMINSIAGLHLPLDEDDMRAAYDLGYAQALEDLQDIITCIQRRDNPSIPI